MPRQVSKQTKTIMKYTEQGMTAGEIAKKLKLSSQYVHNVRYRERKKLERSSTGGGIASAKRTSNAETGIVTLARSKAVKPNEATSKLEPNVMVDYGQPSAPTKSLKPSIWTRIKQVMGWQ